MLAASRNSLLVAVGTVMVNPLEAGLGVAKSEMVQLLEWSLDLMLLKVVVGRRTVVDQISVGPKVALP